MKEEILINLDILKSINQLNGLINSYSQATIHILNLINEKLATGQNSDFINEAYKSFVNTYSSNANIVKNDLEISILENINKIVEIFKENDEKLKITSQIN